MKIRDVFFWDDRAKNTKALTELEITAHARKAILEKLNTADYCQGPISDIIN